MSRPGTQVLSRESVTSRSAPTNTGTAFIVGFTESGSYTEALGPFNSLAEVVDGTGGRISHGLVYDAADVFFREGGAECYIARVGGAGATSGDDNYETAVQADWDRALALFTKDLGPGQVLAPGRTTDAAYEALADHAEANNRVALLDGADTATVATLTTAAAAIDDSRRAALFAPWYTAPGVAGGSARTIPPSAVIAGLIARSDAATGNPNLAAAGPNGQGRYVTDVTRTWSDADRETLNEAGVNVGRNIRGAIQNYGFRTLANTSTDEAWVQLSKTRAHMAIIARGEAIAERYVFAQIDGKGLKASEYQGELTGMLLEFYNLGALYGEAPEEAFLVDVGPGVNTPERIADGELRAVLAVRTSPFAELVTLEVVAVPTTEQI